MPVPGRVEVQDWIIKFLYLGYKSKIDIDKRLRAIFRITFDEQQQRAGASPTSRVQNDLDWGLSVAQNPGGYIRKVEKGIYELTMSGKERAAHIYRSSMTYETIEKLFSDFSTINPWVNFK